MGNFNYSNFHFFDKSGTELMLNKKSTVKIKVSNSSYSKFSSEYALVLSDSNDIRNSVLMKTKDGSRYPLEDPKIIVTLPDGKTNETTLPSQYYDWVEYSSSKGPNSERYPELNYNKLSDEEKESFLELLDITQEVVSYPSLVFEGNLVFDKISTELVETQSIYVLVKINHDDDDYDEEEYDGLQGYIDVSTYAEVNEDARAYISKYDLFFFIDCREQKDFRFFTIDGDEVKWSDRHVMELTKGRQFLSPDNGVRVDIGFRGELEGVYDEKMYVCLKDKDTNEVTVIGTFNMTAETEGEDERYRALFANFGLPPLDETHSVFKETDNSESLPDHISRNKHAKELFLTYSEIFPYAGTYKALINAVKLLGYENDIFFKEWYKYMGNPTPDDDGYVAYDVTFGSNRLMNTLNSKPMEERIHLKKMNWLSVMYRMNEEVEGTEDKFGFPEVRDVRENYYNTGDLVKLISLVEWLNKYVIGVNCRIMDIGGEGVVFERYNLAKFGQYQQVLDYTNEKSISLMINDTTRTIIDGSADIPVGISTASEFDTVENLQNNTFFDFCRGYFDSDSRFSDNVDFSLEDSSSYVYFGNTIERHDNLDSFQLRAIGELDSFVFYSSSDGNPGFIYENHPRIIIDDNRIIFNPNDLRTMPKNAPFINMPIIKLSEARIKRYKKNEETYGKLAYDASVYVNDYGKVVVLITDYEHLNPIDSSFCFNEDITLIPPKYKLDDDYIYIEPRFSKETKKFKSGPFKMWNVDSECMPVDSSFDDKSFGLRFTADTLSGEPAFMISGYECQQMNVIDPSVHFPLTNPNEDGETYEYQIEIFNGSMIFDDADNNRKIVLNFSFDGKEKKVSVKVCQYTNPFTLYDYKIDDTLDESTNRFTNGTEYGYFVKEYREGNSSVITESIVKLINVLNAGTYSIDAIVCDEYNNMFYSLANKKVNVVAPIINTSAYTLDEGEIISPEDASLIRKMSEEDGNICIYEYVPKIDVISISRDKESERKFEIGGIDNDSSAFIDNGTVNFRNDSSFKYVQFTNTTERFVYIGSYTYEGNVVLSFVRRSYKYDSSVGPVGVNEYDDVLNIRGNDDNTVDKVLSSVLEHSIDTSYGSLADVMVTAYDESCEYPLYTYPGVCVPTRLYDGSIDASIDEYRVIFDSSVIDSSALKDFTTCVQKPYVTVYIAPAWSLPCKKDISIYDNDTIEITDKYPFGKKMCEGDVYKILFENKNNNWGSSSYHVKEQTESDDTTTVILDGEINDNDYYFSLRIGPAVRDFSEFITTLSEKESNYGSGTMVLENTAHNRELSYYIDTTYAASFRNFHVRNGIKFWNDLDNVEVDNMYSNDSSISTTGNCVIIIPILKNEYPSYEDNQINILNDKKCTVKWKVYKQHGLKEHTLLFECFNKILTLDLQEPGTYDIDLTVYDKQGNKYTKSIVGAISKEKGGQI